ncbi:two-component system sensor histidine kinase KdpD [Herbaspirillum sp. SJZ130]|nr:MULTISPECIES: sensor histidine kinase KdpD [unclassified Herbaspirillum]MBB5391549.1 two-component system sensor histidine kinase KdpD [Herbaspirillum sp. SJZ102]TQK12768.1 two-component system sensor histidine kinase KdpD [Herbaspirillum sp. SJZ130]TQK14772.1 two-component system sensor histidine kinase KdpD [Herbaspirillum sp. SJZ106]
MTTRPNPDDLLERVMREEDRQARGRLKVFFGFSAGVGKTFAMLEAAQVLRAQSIDVVAGVVETHGRAETEAQLAGIERLPIKMVAYRDRQLPEFDLDAALQRKPQVMLVDELAHSNVPGSRHAKRWQDIDELLRAGIDVYTTLNVQHIESLNDVVGQITGIRVFETVPDHVFDQADDVMLVDIPPDELLARLKQGKVYLPQQAEKAGRNFFRKGNLIALREIALRRTADRVDADMREYRADRSIAQLWQARERIVVAIGSGAGEERLIREAARLATKLQAEWLAVHVDLANSRRPMAGRERVVAYLKLAQSLGAETASISGDDLAAALLQFARARNAGKLVVGQQRGGWRRLLRRPGGSLSQRIAAMGEELDIYAVARPRARHDVRGEDAGRDDSAASVAESLLTRRRRTRGYAWAAVSCAVTTALAFVLNDFLHPANVIMLYLVGVMLVAMRYGRSASALVSVLSVLSFDFFFVAPRFSISVSDAQYLLTLVVMLAVSLFISSLTARLRRQARVAMQREARASNLYMLGKELSALLTLDQILEIGRRHLAAVFGARIAFFLPDSANQLRPAEPAQEAGGVHVLRSVDAGVAQWVYDNGQPAGKGTATLPSAAALYLPLTATMRTRGVLAFAIEGANEEERQLAAAQLALPENRQMLEIFCSQIAMAIERLHYAEVAQDALVSMESERLRNSLLSAISHDLRTPLTSLVGSADVLAATPRLDEDARAMARTIGEQSQKMVGLMNNLLDMARLQAGVVTLNRQWNALEEVAGSALRLLSKALEGRTVETRLPADLPLLRVDAVLLERVFANLVENAIKYSPPGSGIAIAAHVEATESGEQVKVSVSDHGRGFPPAMAQHAFEKFTRGDNESSTPGVGLGLAICRAIVEAHQGRIWIAPQEAGPGATVCFTLPVEVQPALPEE